MKVTISSCVKETKHVRIGSLSVGVYTFGEEGERGILIKDLSSEHGYSIIISPNGTISNVYNVNHALNPRLISELIVKE